MSTIHGTLLGRLVHLTSTLTLDTPLETNFSYSLPGLHARLPWPGLVPLPCPVLADETYPLSSPSPVLSGVDALEYLSLRPQGAALAAVFLAVSAHDTDGFGAGLYGDLGLFKPPVLGGSEGVGRAFAGSKYATPFFV